MKTDVVLSSPISYLAKFWFLRFGPKCCWAIKFQDSLKRIISRTKWKMEFIVAMQIDIEVFYKLILPFWVWVVKHTQITQNKKFAHACNNISRKTWTIKLIFCLEINSKVLVMFWVCVAKHAQSTQNNKFAISLQYVRENLKDEVDFLPADKHQRFLQIDTITLGVCSQTCPNYPK